MKEKLGKDEKALLGAKELNFGLTFSSKKDAKRVYNRIKREMLEARQSENKSDRKLVKDCKVLLKGKKVIFKGGRTHAVEFVEDLIF